MYQITNHLSDNKLFTKQFNASQTIHQPIRQLPNQVSNDIQDIKQFISYTNCILINDNLFSIN